MRRALAVLAAAVLVAGLSFASGAQEKKAADKLAPFCGDYRFDLTSYGAGVITAKVFVENEDLLISSSFLVITSRSALWKKRSDQGSPFFRLPD